MASIILLDTNVSIKEMLLPYLEEDRVFMEKDLSRVVEIYNEDEIDLLIFPLQNRGEEPFPFLPWPVLFILSKEDLPYLLSQNLSGVMEILMTPFQKEEFFRRRMLLEYRGKKRKELREESILEKLEDIIYSASLDGQLLFLNPIALKKYGKAIEVLIIQRLVFLVNFLLETGFNRSEYRLETEMGFRLFEEKTYLVRDEEGKPLRIDGIIYDVTELKHTENALRDGEARMRSIITVIPDILIRFNQDGIFKEIWAQEGIGPSLFPAWLKDKSISQALPEEASNRFLQCIKKAIKERQLKTFEYKMIHFSRPFIFEARIISSGKEEVVAIIRDITDLRQAEESLRRFREAMDSSLDLIFLIDYDTGSILDANNTVSTSLAYSKKELFSMTIGDIYFSLSLKERASLFSSIREKEKIKNRETFFRKKDGLSLPVEVSLKHLEIGSQHMIIASARDISLRLKLRHERDRLFNLSLDMMSITDGDGRFRQVNPAWEKTMGWRKEDLLKESLFGIIHPEDEEEVREKFLQLSQGLSIKNLENRYRCQDGTYRWLSFSLFPVLEEDIIVEVAQDITRRKEDQERLALYTRKIEVTNQKLEEAQRLLKENIAMAGEMHHRFLPRNLPDIPGITFAAYYKPASRVGGDFYNILSLKGQILFYMADVSGHGLDGALLTIFLRETINSFLAFHQGEGEIKPTEIIQYLAKKFYREDFPYDYFISLSIFVLHLETWKLQYCNGGLHIAPCLMDYQGSIRFLRLPGMPISRVINPDEMDFQQMDLTISKGDTLFITTDGLVEQGKNGVYYGQTRMVEVLERNYQKGPEDLVQMMNEDFLSFNGTLQGDDDISFLIMGRWKD